MTGRIARAAALIGVAIAVCAAPVRWAVAQEDAIALGEPMVTIEVAGATADNAEVFIDDLQANGFTAFDDGLLTLDLPFTEATGTFEITVYDRDTGAELFAGAFRLGLPEAEAVRFFDELEAEGSFQNDLVFKPTSRRKPPPDDGLDETDVANDFRAVGSIYGVKDIWSLNADIEVVGTDDDEKVLRPGKSKSTSPTASRRSASIRRRFRRSCSSATSSCPAAPIW